MSAEATTVHLGAAPLVRGEAHAKGQLADWRGRSGFRVDGVDALAPFFLCVVSAGARWMYASSWGAVVLGRRSPEGALFPYETEDRLLACDGRSGSRTALLVQLEGDVGKVYLWEPWLRATDGHYVVERSLWKSRLGDELWLSERNVTLGLTFRVGWASGERFGFQRRVELQNDRGDAVRVRVLDGLVDLQPPDVDRRMQESLACLVDAYRLAELDAGSGLGLFRLSSIPIDRAEPSESLAATCAWMRGLPDAQLLLSTEQLAAFRRGAGVVEERAIRGRRGAFLAVAELNLKAEGSAEWVFGLDGPCDAARALDVAHALGARGAAVDAALRSLLDADLESDRLRLSALVGRADGDQSTDEPRHDARHAANVLFNCMRGGTFLDEGRVGAADFLQHLREVAPRVAARVALRLSGTVTRAELQRAAAETGDLDVMRLAAEFLPLAFSRRHGDPSRPWNRFQIATESAAGALRLHYEGNWRDIFQNWEALLTSYPEYAEAAVAKFLDASTADGYNPYRVTRDGFDWEVPDPSDPWAHIGYWGDHQVVYLQRLLDLAERTAPGALAQHLGERRYVYADVPYRLANFDELRRDPHSTIHFDRERAAQSEQRVRTEGNEGRLLRAGDGGLVRANLAEKLLVPILAKLAHFVPGAGIWMNTQRPEWNDANNALVGHGASVVTTAQLFRHLETVARIFAAAGAPIELDAAIAAQLEATVAALDGDPSGATHDAALRARTLERLGRAGEVYRSAVYSRALGGAARVAVSLERLTAALAAQRRWLAATLAANRRDDGLWHAYNVLVARSDGGLDVRRLPLMLEGQVAVLASGYLAAAGALGTLEALRHSALWRADLGTYLLQPDRPHASFLEKGRIPEELVPELEGALAFPSLLRRDRTGVVRFSPGLTHVGALDAEITAASGTHADASPALERLRPRLLAAYEAAFDHATFTGRSGSFCAYEGLGCVYWHMVSKLRLAIAELCATLESSPPSAERAELLRRLAGHYGEVKRGLSVDAEPEVYGALPTDPYSHTPANGGARQPGMTGQVKEDILARWLELGVRVRDGRLGFVEAEWAPTRPRSISFCGVPVAFATGSKPRLRARLAGGAERVFDGEWLDRETSEALFQRSGAIAALVVERP